MTTATPRSIKELNESVNEKFEALKRLDTQRDELIQALDNDLAGNEHLSKKNSFKVDELRRKSRGITAAHKEIAAIKRSIESQNNRDTTNPLIEGSVKAELERLDNQLKTLFGDVTGQLETFRGEFENFRREVRTELNEHTTQLGDHEQRIGRQETENDMNVQGLASLHGRVGSIETYVENEVKTKFPIGRILIALVFGVIGFFVWRGFHFTQSKTLADGSTLKIDYPFANSVGAAVGFGAVVFCIALGLMLFLIAPAIKKSTATRKEQQYIEQRTSATPIPAAPVQGTTDASLAPTKVIPTNAGADSSRS